ncbi:MAG TPA: twin-arginine translocation signal domain-containing protein, partial [Pricia sp.]|nr:twin-arginine translocation signal domain-containing protein [Pricia sp.]
MSTTPSSLTFSRRNFLRTSSLAGGGLLIGFNLLTACKSDVKPVSYTHLRA